jgi:hypothetical protein
VFFINVHSSVLGIPPGGVKIDLKKLNSNKISEKLRKIENKMLLACDYSNSSSL